MAELSARAQRLFEEPNILFVATVNPDGSPQVTPVWTELDGGRPSFNTAIGRVKERNLRRDPRVGLSVTARDDAMNKVDIVGRVIAFVEGEEAVAQIDDLAEKYLGERPYPWLGDDRRVKLVVEPLRVYGA
jgi:PPOX class probable F420-dependent enzyme